jgi:hypothetical protein
MAEKHIVVQGAQCLCRFGTAPDRLRVLGNSREYGNDSEGLTRAIATTVDTGTTFEKNTFGSCSVTNNRPCNAVVSKWSGFYEKVTLSNGGKMLLEDSKGTCPVGGADCIGITHHGQRAEASQGNFDHTDVGVRSQLNPLGENGGEWDGGVVDG